MIAPPSFVRVNACCGRPLLKVRQMCENVEFLGTQLGWLELKHVAASTGRSAEAGWERPGFRALALYGWCAFWIGEMHGEQHAQ